jgi:hypothetical protein
MKTTALISITVLVIAACSSSKKVTTPAPSPAPVSANTPTENNILFIKKPMSGIYVPGNEELSAIQLKYKDATLEQLKKGHSIYTEGACINCHAPKSIYLKEEALWKDLIDDMAQRAKISEVEKDAVYKYVLAIKATQPK